MVAPCHATPVASATFVAWAMLLVAVGCARPVAERVPIVGLSLPATVALCADATIDEDRDALDDRCELALARAFAPELRVDARECGWRDDVAPARLAGGYLFAAQRTRTGVRLAYLPAYFRDCGWSGAVCLLVAGGCGAHAGDSELIVVDVAASAPAGRWRATGVFLSAHCLGGSAGRCRWFRGDALHELEWADDVAGGAPRVWVARGKHANYPTQRACDRGHWTYDSCDGNGVAVRFPVRSTAQNAGSRQHPLLGDGCLSSEELPLGPAGADAGMRECMWDASRSFRGWQRDRTGSEPAAYARYLELFAGF
jgi:hypothetical protein